MKKKFFTLLFVIMASVVSTHAVNYSGTCGDNLTWELKDTVLTISGEGDMTTWEKDVNVPWVMHGTTYIAAAIKEIVISKDVASICPVGMYVCTNVNKVTIQSNYIVGKDYASRGLDSIFGSYPKVFIVGDTAQRIGNRAFYNFSNLKSIAISKNITSIGEEAFRNCSGLTNITIPDNVTAIGDAVFCNCSGLTSVSVGSKVTNISNSAFRDCYNLPSIVIPNSATSIGNDAFYRCSKLTSAIIGNGVKSIGENAFEECTNLTTLTIGNSVTSIGDRAFYNCWGVTSIDIPNSVTSIGEKAFGGCSALTELNVGSGVNSYASNSFEGCSKLTKVTVNANIFVNQDVNSKSYLCNVFPKIKECIIGDNVTKIGDHAFLGCTDLTSVTIGKGVTSIGEGACMNCSLLTSVTIGSGVKSIGNNAFSYCDKLESFTCYATNPPTLGSAAFYNTKSSLVIYVPQNSVASYKNATGWKDLTIQGISGSVTTNYTVTVLSDNTSMGTVSGGGTFESGKSVTVTATPKSGYKFTRWSDYSTKNPYTFTVTKDVTLTAYFEQSEVSPTYYTVTFKDWDGTVLKTEQVEEGHSATAPADPTRDGYTFIGWDRDFNNVQYNLTVNARYKKDETPTKAITVRLRPESAWKNVYLWAWTADGNVFSSWPGQIISKDADGWYSYTFSESISSVNIIWNNGTDQTVDINNVTTSTCFALDDTEGKKITVSMVDCQSSASPTAAELSQLGYDVSNKVVLCFHFDERVCNDVVLAGNYNDWNVSDVSKLYKFEPIRSSKYTGWYVAEMPFDTNAEYVSAKPIQLRNDGTFSWDYQCGDKDAWIYRGGKTADVQVSDIEGECHVNYPTAGAYIYEIAYWKLHKNPCNLTNYKVYYYDTNDYSYAVCYWNDASTNTVTMNPVFEHSGWYEASLPSDCVDLLFVAYPLNTTFSWDAYFYKTGDLVCDGTNVYYVHNEGWQDGFGETTTPSFPTDEPLLWPIMLDEETAENYQSAIAGDFRLNGYDNNLWVWENTYTAGTATGKNFYGLSEGWIALTVTAPTGWSGLGFNIANATSLTAIKNLQRAIVSDPDNYFLHLAIKSTDNASHQFYIFGNDNTSFAIGTQTIEKGSVIGDFNRDGTWQEFYIPMTQFASAIADKEISSSIDILCVLSGNQVGAQLNLDAVYFCNKYAKEHNIPAVQDPDNYNHVKIGDLYYNLDGKTATAEVTSEDIYSNYKGLTTIDIPASVTYEGYSYSVTSISESAFYDCGDLTSVTIPARVASIGSAAFAGCPLTTITNLATTPQVIDENVFMGNDEHPGANPSTCVLYVPEEAIALYKAAEGWKDFQHIEAIPVEGKDEVQVVPTETTATISWPKVTGAYTYELVIHDGSGNIVCTLTFDAEGHLISLAFGAPARDNDLQAAGFSFTVTGLKSGTAYSYTLQAKDSNGAVLQTETGSFTTLGADAVDHVTTDKQITKLIRGSQLFILRDGKAYTAQGQQLK